MDRSSFRLVEAEAEKRRENQYQRMIFWGLTALFWAIAGIILVSPSRSPVWLRLAVTSALVVMPALGFLLAKTTGLRLVTPRRVPIQFEVSSEGVQVQYVTGVPAIARWDDPALRLTFLEATYPGEEPRRWLHIGDMSVYEGIRVNPAVFGAISESAERNGLTRTVNSRQARWPDRRLAWVVFSRAG
jgi:hypothetical protein